MTRTLLLLGAAMTIAAPAHATDLVEAWQAALAHDPDYRSAEASRDAGQEFAAQARALKRPSVQLQTGYQYSGVETDAQFPDDLDPLFSGTRNSARATVGLQAVQPIYDASKRAQATQLQAKAAGAEAQFSSAQQDLILRVAQAYFAVLAGEDKVASYDRQVDAAEQQRRAAQARFDAGRAKITDVRDAEAQRDAAQAQRIAAEAELATASDVFRELTGLVPSDLHRPTEHFTAPLPPLSADDAGRRAEVQSLQVKAATQAARAAGADIDRYRLAGRPVVEGVAGYQGQYRTDGDRGNGIVPDRVQSASVGVRLTVPLYAGGAIASKEREARANAAKAQRDLDAARRDARLSAQKAWYAASTGARRIAALETAQASADAKQQAAAIGRDVGNRTQTDLLNAQSQSLANARDRSVAVYDYLVARLQLSAAMGELGPDQLAEINNLIEGT
ncbi:TolC family outer membrane protein [Caulobacter sp.]|uniref:TolC family outer membrane protein n=1 Tax=Caulobacter sp. TaxID=78 RepID=UPI0031E42F13